MTLRDMCWVSIALAGYGSRPRNALIALIGACYTILPTLSSLTSTPSLFLLSALRCCLSRRRHMLSAITLILPSRIVTFHLTLGLGRTR